MNKIIIITTKRHGVEKKIRMNKEIQKLLVIIFHVYTKWFLIVLTITKNVNINLKF